MGQAWRVSAFGCAAVTEDEASQIVPTTHESVMKHTRESLLIKAEKQAAQPAAVGAHRRLTTMGAT